MIIRNKILIICAVALLLLTIIGLVTSGHQSILPNVEESHRLIVPDDYPDLIDAIGNATEGTTIFIKKGDYNIAQTDLFINKTLAIIGEDQDSTRIITPPDTRYGFEFFASKIAFRVHADSFKISNLTITNSDYGVYLNGNDAQITNISTSSIYVNGNQSVISKCNTTLTSAIQNTITTSGSFNHIQNNYFWCITCEGSDSDVTENTGQISGGQISIAGLSNVIAKNTVAFIKLSDSKSNTIYNNSVSSIEIQGSYNNTIHDNIVKGGSTVWGVLMGSGSGNIFYGNYIGGFDDVSTANGRRIGYGVAIGGYDNVAENNLFFHNSFVNNYKDVSANWPILGKGNQWDNGSEGNYWDDYTGADVDDDGLGDVRYEIRGIMWDARVDGHVSTIYGQDNHPLMKPVNISASEVSP